MTQTLVAVDHLRITRADGSALVRDVSFALEAGETVGIVGESGSGKSLTLRALMGILPPTLHAAGDLSRAARMAMIFQEPATALNPTMRVGDLVALAWRRHHDGCSKADARKATVDLFERVGIAQAAERFKAWPHELSGGMRQRVMIAAALATDPDVLLCDEPTTALDVRVQAQILTLLSDLVVDRDMAMIFVSHDLAVVSSVCKRIVVMRHGEVVEAGSMARVVDAPAHPYTAELLAANLSRRLAHTTGALR